MSDFQWRFIDFALQYDVLRFGNFRTKAGRPSPYFFNAGLFNDGFALKQLGQFYAQAILASGIRFDALFGPAYKGIPLVSTIAIALAEAGHNHPFSFNRKEIKDHGEGGDIVGAPLAGRILIVDDVVSAGLSVGESITLIHAAGATPCGIMVALDRMEKGKSECSTLQEIKNKYDIPVISLITLDDIIAYLHTRQDLVHHIPAIETYRTFYGAKVPDTVNHTGRSTSV
ncbi:MULTISPECIES: orotate phosphoribosyltransferase [Nitrosomonas]|uniref:Orotate phosphoribosyltransferase n=2 Tax=Nitrosomonas TaxID=914 RepID=PYRE_NITEU|nr:MULTISPECIES: orotate phosphoribosyltransferase [Nitrosomonas]Q820K1.1 RecName: Full=Orotate phosphoribosyltransferase; Short=OPRT; Short=OPRTase [Nitrosomonas europaea ATCC 19718]KXK49991.1 MAG: orotate phosphoribosyltransferase [Nitrosomonas europaea]MBV6388817.1 Orotate phosphoribosyltransferase [Nitrosomonas europaea]CAD85645.1 Phosphoribosyl transferase:Orotate phosphoribosyltransferase [Nitrosomonas europaea ATCC 19718]SDW47903.1 orotate phosphoribosyltransferase [Nitrosomonas europae